MSSGILEYGLHFFKTSKESVTPRDRKKPVRLFIYMCQSFSGCYISVCLSKIFTSVIVIVIFTSVGNSRGRNGIILKLAAGTLLHSEDR